MKRMEWGGMVSIWAEGVGVVRRCFFCQKKNSSFEKEAVRANSQGNFFFRFII